MLSGGIELLCDSTRKHIHRTLKYELGDSVQIFPDNKGKLLMVPDSVSLQDVVLENQGLRRELEIWKAKVTDFNKIIVQTSSQIRSAIKEDMAPTPWPYHPSDVNSQINWSVSLLVSSLETLTAARVQHTGSPLLSSLLARTLYIQWHVTT